MDGASIPIVYKLFRNSMTGFLVGPRVDYEVQLFLLLLFNFLAPGVDENEFVG